MSDEAYFYFALYVQQEIARILTYISQNDDIIILDINAMQPSKLSSAIFAYKSFMLQQKQHVINVVHPLKKHKRQALVNYVALASHKSFLWHVDDMAEIDQTAGKVENLRLLIKALNGVVIPKGEIFSFWRQLGRLTQGKGYVVGRELREGCLIPSFGGGICQFTNGLYDCVLKAGFEVVERHGHSQVIAGSLSEQDRDATVFWNYIDLKFKPNCDVQIQSRLSKDLLHISFVPLEKRSASINIIATNNSTKAKPQFKNADDLGNCFSCDQADCFRHQPQNSSVDFGKTALLLDAIWPEYQHWCADQPNIMQSFTPLDGQKRGRANYAWALPKQIEAARLTTMRRALAIRRAPASGAALQSTILKYDKKLADIYARKLDYRANHLVIAQNLLPHLSPLALGGRSYEVLMTRWPLGQLQRILDDAKAVHPYSKTLGDFRVDQNLVKAESHRLAKAERLVTPHVALAEYLRDTYPAAKVELINWHMPEITQPEGQESNDGGVFLPASLLARKGVYEIAEAFKGKDLYVLGRAFETDMSHDINIIPASISDMANANTVILPAYIENQPRLLLRALAMGKKVIATVACGLPEQSGLTLLDNPADFKNFTFSK